MDNSTVFHLGDLHPSPSNPRIISDEEIRFLKNSLSDLGDLSGIVFNRATQHLVSGHQRVRAIQDLGLNPDITITEHFTEPTPQGTVAVGYFFCNGEKYGYREVSWSETQEKVAMVAANRMGGHWDTDKLGAVLDSLLASNQGDVALLEGTGFDQAFLKAYVSKDEELRYLLMSDAASISLNRGLSFGSGCLPEPDGDFDDLEDNIVIPEADEISQDDPSLKITCPKCGHVFFEKEGRQGELSAKTENAETYGK